MSPVVDRSDLPAMETTSRLKRLREHLGEAECEALLVTSLVNVRYLTGFSGSAAMLLVTEHDTLFVSDGRYRDQARAQLEAAGVEADIEIGRPAEQIEAVDRRLSGIRRLGLEAGDVSWASKRHLAAALGAFASSKGSLIATEGLVERLRRTKDEGELARIELAASIADVAIAQVKEKLLEAPSEVEFALDLDFEMRRRGADGVSFETIVGSGPNGAMPHARPSQRQIEPGELVVLDFGALVDGYHSDMTRMFCVGEVASDRMTEMLDAVLAAQRAGVRLVRAGAACVEVDAACRQSLEEADLAELFTHGTGHGVGLEIHEAPSLGKTSTDVLEEGDVVTVEPGVYVPDLGGVRIEDTLAVTATGSRPLTKSTKDTTI